MNYSGDITYILSELDVRVIKSSLKALLKQCEELIKLDDKVSTFDITERLELEEKIRAIKELLETM